jgi:hypothetical protein
MQPSKPPPSGDLLDLGVSPAQLKLRMGTIALSIGRGDKEHMK